MKVTLLLPDGLLQLASVTPPGIEVEILDEKVEPLPETLETDLVGISVFTTRGALRPLYRAPRPDLTALPSRHPWHLLRTERSPAPRVLQTTRGCPVGCEFCSVTAFNGKTMRHKRPGRLFEELEELAARAMVDRGLEIRWVTQATTALARKAALLSLARRSGCVGVLIGEGVFERTVEFCARTGRRECRPRLVRRFSRSRRASRSRPGRARGRLGSRRSGRDALCCAAVSRSPSVSPPSSPPCRARPMPGAAWWWRPRSARWSW